MAARTPAPKPAAKPAAAAPARRQLAWTLGLVAAAVALVAGLLWLNRPEPVDPLRLVAADILGRFNQGLPREFAPGLTLERVHFEDTNLVMTLRSDKLDADLVAADPQMAATVRNAEMEQMLLLCDDRDVVYLLARGASLTRRFIDQRGRPFFDVTLEPAHCRRGR